MNIIIFVGNKIDKLLGGLRHHEFGNIVQYHVFFIAQQREDCPLLIY